MSLTGLVPPEAPGESLFLPFPASGGAHVPWLTARPPPSQSSPGSPVSLTLILPPPAYKDPCGALCNHIGPVWIIQAHPHLKVLNLTPSAKSVTIDGGIHRFWGLGRGRLCWGRYSTHHSALDITQRLNIARGCCDRTPRGHMTGPRTHWLVNRGPHLKQGLGFPDLVFPLYPPSHQTNEQRDSDSWTFCSPRWQWTCGLPVFGKTSHFPPAEQALLHRGLSYWNYPARPLPLSGRVHGPRQTRGWVSPGFLVPAAVRLPRSLQPPCFLHITTRVVILEST